MRLEIGRLVRDIGIARCVRLVESVFGELDPVVPDFLDGLLRPVPVAFATFEELDLEFFHQVEFLLPHRLAKLIALTAGKPGQIARKQHQLLLIHGDAIRFFQAFLHRRQVVGNRLASRFPGDKARDIIHRPRPVQRIHGDQVLEPARPQIAQMLLHAVRFELEGPGRVTPAEQLKCLFIVQRNG